MEPRLTLDGNPIVSINTNLGQFKIELLQDTAPLSVANFLNYVNGGDFSNSIFHRSVPGFVVQGGGFTTNSATFVNTSQLTPVPTDPPVQNEFQLSNLRGTVAMAKLGGNPNSATSQWFVNLGNNSQNLDNQNGGFTVFGRVLGDGMAVADAIAALPRSNQGGAFNELPLGPGNQLALVSSIVVNGTILGTVYNDADNNGQQAQNEVGLAGFTVFVDANNNGLRDANEAVSTTDSNGKYRFPGLDPGSYNVRIASPGWTNTSPAAGSLNVNVTAGQDATGQDFGLKLAAPSAVTLLSDTGASNSDGVTQLNNTAGKTVSFSVAGVAPGAFVQILEGATVIGQANATGSTVSVITDASHTFADGGHSITAMQTHSGISSAVSSAVTITVDSAAPVYASTAPGQLEAGAPLSYNAETDEEGQTGLTYSLVAFPNGMSVSPLTGVFSWTPNASQTGNQNVTLRATDLAGNASDQSFAITVTNSAPVLANPGSVTVDENTVLRITTTATDSNLPSDSLFFSLGAGSPVGASIDGASGVLTWTPGEADGPGAVSIKIRVTDAGGLFDEKSLNITVREVNQTPRLTPIGRQFVLPGEVLSLTVQATDADLPANALQFSLDSGAPDGASIDPVTGVLTWTAPEQALTEPVSFTVRVTDAAGLFSEQTFSVDVFDGSLSLFLANATNTGPSAILNSALLGFLTDAPQAPQTAIIPLSVPPAILTSNPDNAAVDATIGPNTGVPHTSEAMRLPAGKRVTTNKPAVTEDEGVHTEVIEQPEDKPLGPSRKDLQDQGRREVPPSGDKKVNPASPLNFVDRLVDDLLEAAFQAIAAQRGAVDEPIFAQPAEAPVDELSDFDSQSDEFGESNGSVQALAAVSMLAVRRPKAAGGMDSSMRRRCGIERLQH